MPVEIGKGGLFPSGWCSPAAQEMVLAWLRWLDLQPEGKKQLLIAWCDCAEVELTRSLVEQVLGIEGS